MVYHLVDNNCGGLPFCKKETKESVDKILQMPVNSGKTGLNDVAYATKEIDTVIWSAAIKKVTHDYAAADLMKICHPNSNHAEYVQENGKDGNIGTIQEMSVIQDILV